MKIPKKQPIRLSGGPRPVAYTCDEGHLHAGTPVPDAVHPLPCPWPRAAIARARGEVVGA